MVTANAIRRETSRRDGVPIAVKHYRVDDIRRFKCWGSGYRNELVAGWAVGSMVPRLVDAWRDAQGDYAALEWLDGEPVRPEAVATDLAVRIGTSLGAIHDVNGPGWGSLDGAF